MSGGKFFVRSVSVKKLTRGYCWRLHFFISKAPDIAILLDDTYDHLEE